MLIEACTCDNVLSEAIIIAEFDINFLYYRYVAWNMHEAQEGKYNFDGNSDLVGFIQMAQSAGLLVIVRAGESNVYSTGLPFA